GKGAGGVNVKILVRSRTIFDGYRGFEADGYRYHLAVGPVFAQAPNGDLLVSFLTGGATEPAPDNVAAYMRSTDGGRTWSEPKLLAPKSDENSLGSIYRRGDELVAACAYWPEDGRYTVMRPF